MYTWGGKFRVQLWESYAATELLRQLLAHACHIATLVLKHARKRPLLKKQSRQATTKKQIHSRFAAGTLHAAGTFTCACRRIESVVSSAVKGQQGQQ